MLLSVSSYQINAAPEGIVITAAIDSTIINGAWDEALVTGKLSKDKAILTHEGVTISLIGFPENKVNQNLPVYLAGLNASGAITFSCRLKLEGVW